MNKVYYYKNCYKIIYQKPIFDRGKAIQAYKQWKNCNIETANLVKKLKKEGLLNRHLISDMSNLKDNYYRLINLISQKKIIRKINGKEFNYLCNKSDNDQIPHLRNALHHIKREIQNYRYDRKDFIQNVKVESNYWFFKQQERAFKDKFPYSEDKYIGIEIECIVPKNLKDKQELIEYRKYISIADDGSIEDYDNDEEESREYKILVKESELESTVTGICDKLNSLGAYVNKSCGLHVHFDLRETTKEQREEIYGKLYHSLTLIKSIVPKTRRENHFCKINTENKPAYTGSRYQAINSSAYLRHRTFEIRLFNGTINASKILNWIKLLQSIINGKSILRCPKSFETAKTYWNLSEDLIAWCKERQTRFNLVTYGGSNVQNSDNS
jgi:hypothetical protein